MSFWEQDRAGELGISQEEFRSRVVEGAGHKIPLGKNGEAEDVANMVAFLASDDANFITGQAYNVNGGLLFHYGKLQHQVVVESPTIGCHAPQVPRANYPGALTLRACE